MKQDNKRALAELNSSITVESLPGVFRTTLAYNEQVMLCRFLMKKGARIPLHSHEAVQTGFVISGRVRFHRAPQPDPSPGRATGAASDPPAAGGMQERGGAAGFTATAGTSYVFDSHEQHGAEVLEDAELIECFAPMRPEYVPPR